jgi:hypothetical protein
MTTVAAGGARHRKNADAREQAPRIGWTGSGWNALRLN